MEAVDGIIDSLEELREEDGVSKLVQEKIDELLETIREPIDLELRIDRMRSILDELEENQNIPMYIRTQLWNLAAALELL